MDGKQVVTLRQ
jgi:hypothetical protein